MLKTEKSATSRLILLFSLTYMVSYMTRINYGAVLAEMETATAFSRSLLSMAVTGSFITYGAGQIITGIFGDRLSPKKLISFGLCVTVCMNLLIPLCRNPYEMLAVWCVNGFAQSFMWPPLVRLMTEYFPGDAYKKATVRVSWGSSAGTIAVYLLAPVIISLLGWRYVFVVSAFIGIGMIILWNLAVPDPGKPDRTPKAAGSEKSAFLSPVVLAVMLTIVLQGMLRDGVTTWMPSYISETFRLSSEISILSGVILPIFSILSLQAASALYRRHFQNPLTCAGVIFGLGAVSSLALWLFPDASAVFSVFFSALLSGCMHGVNLMLVCMLPAYFARFGNVSTASGLLNACTYVGSAVSTYGIALLSDSRGWGFTIALWFMIAAVGTVLCLLCAKPWQKKFEE
ncbi:MAG: MFS transporter [Clostridia bacterium]|nr:MFS transporter [Clostridia bacterium]